MMNVAKCPDLKIPNGSNISNVLKFNEIYGDAEELELYGNNNTDGVITYTIEASPDPDAATPEWYTVLDGAGDAAPPAQGKTRIYGHAQPPQISSAGGLRIKSSANVTADRSWRVTKKYDI